MQEVLIKTVVTKIDNQVKAIHFTTPFTYFNVETLQDDSKETIKKSSEEFRNSCALSFDLFVTTLTIFKNVTGVEENAIKIENEIKKEKIDETKITSLFKGIEECINECYIGPTPIFVEF